MQAVIERHFSETVRDVVSLAKPRITLNSTEPPTIVTTT